MVALWARVKQKQRSGDVLAHISNTVLLTSLQAILATTVGKVLIIDEAYMLYTSSGTGGGSGGAADMYKIAVSDYPCRRKGSGCTYNCDLPYSCA